MAPALSTSSFAPEVEPQPSEGSRRGQTYAAAGGKSLPNQGEKVVQALTSTGRQVATRWQVVETTQPLMSVHQMWEQGNVVVLGAQGGYVLNLQDGSQTPIAVRDNVYVMDLYLPPKATFRRQGQ